MSLENKISQALQIVENNLEISRNPIIMTSFGKDSMVLIDLVRKINSNIPCLFHKEPFFPKKYEFSNKVISDLDLTVYDFAPCATAVQSTDLTDGGQEFEIVNYYNCGEKVYVVPTGIIEPEDYNKPFLCGFVDLLSKPVCDFNYPWDIVFVGHKSTDTDVFYDSIELKVEKTRVSSTTEWVFPLRYFSDADIWEYTDKYNIAWNKDRYDRGQAKGKETFRNQFKDMTYNPDYFECCMKCLDKKEKDTVFCHKFNKEVPNISSKVPYQDHIKLDYFGN